MKRRHQMTRRAQRSLIFAPERTPLLPRGAKSAALIAIAVIALDGVPKLVWAQDATWTPPNPGGNTDFNNHLNWTPEVVPTGTAFFGPVASDDAKGVFIFSPPALTPLTQFVFQADAANYSIGVFSGATLQFSGGGVQNLSGIEQIIVVETGGTINFTNSSTAGEATIGYSNRGGAIVFNGGSTAGAANFENQSNGTITFINSHAGDSVISNNFGGGSVIFEGSSTADGDTLLNNTTAGGGRIIFADTSNADNAKVQNFTSGDSISFQDASSAGNAIISTVAGSTIEFVGTSSADMNWTPFAGPRVVEFKV